MINSTKKSTDVSSWVDTPYRVIEMKTLSLFSENPQSNDHMSDFWNRFTQQTQQFLCTSNSWLKGAETKKIKERQRNRHNNHHCSSHLNKETENVREQNTKIQEKNATRPLLALPHPDINQPPSPSGSPFSKSKHSPFCKEIQRIMIKLLFFK